MTAIKHKALDLVRSFNAEEIRDFRKLIASPLHSKGRNYIKLLNEILKHDSNEELSSHKLYAKLYPGKKFSSQTLKNRFTELFKLGEEFLVFKKLDKEPVEKEMILLEEYLDKKLYRLFESKYKKTKKFVETLPEDKHKFRHTFFLGGINLSLLDKKNTMSKMHTQYYDRAKYSLYLFLIEIFRQGIEFKLYEHANIKFDPNIIQEFLDKLRIETLVESMSTSNEIIQKTVCMYYYLYKANEKPFNEKYYLEMQKIFAACKNHFSDEYKEEIYEKIIDYCTMRQNAGNEKFQLELFRVYNEKLEQGLYSNFRQDQYPVNNFRDHVLIGIEIKKYKWVEEFIQKYSKELPAEIREHQTNLSYGRLFFSKHDFKRSLEHLNKVGGLNYLHYADASVLKMCCYYELNRLEDSYYEIDKLRHYLRNRRDMPVIHKVPNINFIKIYQKLINNRSKAIKKDLGFLEKEIRQLKFIAKGRWLLEKLKVKS